MRSDKRISDIEWKKGICGICPSGCWIEAGLRDGMLVDIRADTDHSLGMLCTLGQHAPEIVYSRHRLRYPLKRRGRKGTYEFERITWDEAYDAIVLNLNRIKNEYGPEAVSIYTGRGAMELSLCDMFQPQGVAVSSASNILFPFGSPNTMGVGALCYVSLHMIAPLVTMGRMQTNMFNDIENAEMVVVWGANPATDSPPADMGRIEEAVGKGAEVVVIDPCRTETALRSNAQWVPVRPGTDCALALSMISVIIDEELYNEDFVENWCHGFAELKNYVQHFIPEVVQEITGVNAGVIKNLARRICRASGACPVMYTGLEFSNCGVQTARAVLILFALANQLDVPGGIGLNMLGDIFPINRSCNQKNPDLDKAVARYDYPVYSDFRGESHAKGLLDSVLKGKPYHIRSLIIHGASLLTSWPATPVWRDMLSNLDFTVCIDRQFTADAAYADIVLPATTMFEITSYMTYGPLFRVREKLIEPLGKARNDYLIMAELAARLGYGHLYPQSEEDLVNFALDGSGYTLQGVRKAGGFVRVDTPMMEYKKWLKGSLRDDGKPGFQTPGGKFEIWSTVLDDYGYEPLPRYIEPVEGPGENSELALRYPLVLITGACQKTAFRSQHHGVEGLMRENPEPVVLMNTGDADRRAIADGDLVEVTTIRGRVPFRASVTENIIEGIVECDMGGGTPIGPLAWQTGNVNELTDIDNCDAISGFPVYRALLCDVELKSKGKPEQVCTESSINRDRKYGGPIFKKKVTERHIYLDNNATTPVAAEVRDAMSPFLSEEAGNPSSLHNWGKNSRDAIENARRQLARLLNTQSRRLIMTAGGSEADNLAIKGVALALKERGNHIITSNVEHPAVLKTCRFLEKLGFEVTYLEVDRNGLLLPDCLREAINERTVLVSIMLANNETGTILPVKELAEVAHERGVLFHTDAVQAIGKVKVDVSDLNIDLLSLSGHKFHAPKGIGALFLKKGISLEPLIHGGNQESGFRAGTENVPAIVGLGKAAELALSFINDMSRVKKMRDMLEMRIKELIPGAEVNGHIRDRLPNTLNITLPGLRGESIVIAMSRQGIALSSGSACKAGSPEPTHVLLSMGRSEQQAHCSVRFSLSHYTSEDDIEQTIEALKNVLHEKNTIRLIPCK